MYEKELAWLLKEKYGGKASSEFERDRARILAGEPVDYVIGYTDFLGTRIFLNHHPLIPRPETEYWVELLIARLKATPPVRMLDLFTGSGAIGIALKHAFPSAELTLSDVNPSALLQAKENLEKNALAGKVVASNVYERISGGYDLITANPPYIRHGSTRVAESVRAHEPHDALYAHERGFGLVRETLEGADAHLVPGGLLAMEFDDVQQLQVEGLAKRLGWNVEIIIDQYGVTRAGFFTKEK